MNNSRRKFISQSVSALSLAATSNVISFPLYAKEISYGPERGIARLNWNENPYGPSKKALQAIIESSYESAYYPDHLVNRLKDMIAEKHELTQNHITISAGSTQALTVLSQIQSRKNPIISSELTWDIPLLIARSSGGKIIRVENGHDLEINLQKMQNLHDENISMVHICNPNNPTGTIIDPEKLSNALRIMSKTVLVLVDEAYNEVTDNPEANTMIKLIKEGHNIAISRTFSKIYGMAGQRVGYIIAKPEIIRTINRKGTGEFSTAMAGVSGAIACYNDEEFLKFSKSKINEAKEMIIEVAKSNGLETLPSQTNFIYVNLGNINADTFRDEMRKQNIIIAGKYGKHTNWSRVSMGKIEDIQRYVDAFPAVLDHLTI